MVNYVTGGSALGVDIDTTEIQDGAITSAKFAAAAVGSTIEVNTLAYDSITQGTFAAAASTDFYKGVGMYNNGSHNINDEIVYKVFLHKGTYKVAIIATVAANRAIHHVYIDGTDSAQCDLYSAASVHRSVIADTGIVIATSGLKTIAIKAESKHASSSDYYIAMDAILFIRTA